MSSSNFSLLLSYLIVWLKWARPKSLQLKFQAWLVNSRVVVEQALPQPSPDMSSPFKASMSWKTLDIWQHKTTVFHCQCSYFDIHTEAYVSMIMESLHNPECICIRIYTEQSSTQRTNEMPICYKWFIFNSTFQNYSVHIKFL